VILKHTKFNLCSFWQEVIIERLQRKIQSNYDMETLYIYDELSKFYGKQFRLPYTGQTIEATFSQHRKDVQWRKIKRKKANVETCCKTLDVTDVDEESDYSETEDSCEMLDFTEFDESYIVIDPEKM
ncbi:1115_t:CDS:2, partial [Funneliformis caledonium]